MSQFTIESFTTHPQELVRLYDWIFDTIQPYIMGRVLEVNSADGYLSSKLIEQGFKVQLNAVSERHREQLREKFKKEPLIRGIHKIDFLDSELEPAYEDFQERFSTVLAFNNLEDQLLSDRKTVDKARRFLHEGGHLIVIGQPETSLFPGAQLDILELKKHTRDSIRNLLSNCNVLKTRYFDCNGTCFLAVGRKL